MTLLALIVALWASREAFVPNYFAQCQWGIDYLKNIQQKAFMETLAPALGYAVYLAVPVLLAWYIQSGRSAFLTLLELLAAVAVLLASLRYHQVEAALEPLLQRWRDQDWQGAYEYGAEYFDYGKMVSPGELLSQTITQYWLKMNQTLFAPLFWYSLFGVAGALFYLLTRLLSRGVEVGSEAPAWAKIGREFLHSLDAVPARAIALTIAALCLNPKVVAVAFRRFRSTDREAEVLLKLAVKMGLNLQDAVVDETDRVSEGVRRINAVRDLRSNVMIFWLVVLAVFIIIA